MILDVVIQRLSRYNESIVDKRFKRLGLRSERLDRQGSRKRPEFLVSDSHGPVLACEVKTVFSGGFLRDRNAHLSTQDPAFLNSGVFGNEIDFSRIDDCLRDAVGKLRCLVEDTPAYLNLPFLVVFFFDFFADHFGLYPARMPDFPEVSGIAKIESDLAIKAIAEKMSLEELKKRIKSGSMKGFPANSKDFVLVGNECATHALAQHFVEMCIQSG